MAYTTGVGGSAIPERQFGQRETNTQKQIEQLQRQRVEFPAGSGGPVGIVNMTADQASIGYRDDSSEIAFEMVSYYTPELVYGRSGWLRMDGSDIYVAPGWYHPVFLVDLSWTTGTQPNGVQLFMGGGADFAHQTGGHMYAPVPNYNDTTRGVSVPLDLGPTYMTATDYLRAEVQFTKYPTGPLVGTKMHAWSITKLA